jgi:hypothetical protein
MITFSQLSKLDPKPEKLVELSILFGGGTWIKAQSLQLSLNEVYEAAIKLAIKDKQIEKRIGLWGCDCAAHVLHLFEIERPKDNRPRNTISISRKFYRDAAWDAAGDAAWDAVRDAAWDAVGDAAGAAYRAAAWDAAEDAAWDAARDAAWDAVGGAARTAARAAARTAARAAARAAARTAVGDAARDAEEKWQLERLILWLSDNPPKDFN